MGDCNREKNFVSVVIYIHNCEKRIEIFLQTIMEVLEENFEHSEIICVNDSSNDRSPELIKSVSQSAKTTGISIVNLSYFHGLEAAMHAGTDLAIGDFVLEFDHTLLDYDKAEIMRVYRKSLEGYDMVSAVPDRKERLSSRLFYLVFRRFAAVSGPMCTESFRILSRRVINRILSMNKTVPYRKAIYAGVGLRADTIRYMVTGQGEKIPADPKEKRYRIGLAVDAFIFFTELGYRAAIVMTMLMLFLSVSMVVYVAVIYAAAHPVAGWTTTLLFLSTAFAGLFGILTVIVKYLQLLVNLVFKRKQYSFESIEKLTKE
ncbi:MAG: glycosyltransferase [Eubacterium sp.]|nr:glycosyltransferase [Eubacterium sp.]